jgi:hypothetical protein
MCGCVYLLDNHICNESFTLLTSRHYMEIIEEWYWHYRTEGELRGLAIEAGFSEENITVGRENETVNLFLHLKNG